MSEALTRSSQIYDQPALVVTAADHLDSQRLPRRTSSAVAGRYVFGRDRVLGPIRAHERGPHFSAGFFKHRDPGRESGFDMRKTAKPLS